MDFFNSHDCLRQSGPLLIRAGANRAIIPHAHADCWPSLSLQWLLGGSSLSHAQEAESPTENYAPHVSARLYLFHEEPPSGPEIQSRT